MKKNIFTVIATILMFLGSASSVFACAVWAYQPKTPKSLQR
ncbi:cyclic lactone autoinducer peptide [Desulfosporosinus hippei]|uniref:Cyclic lactone autoinducer peptide n=1 Tax=Desulfosporosinus hippei DSM 8344 TaxID=1121419 RepID=A0A1G8AMK2_9FIRM|nr:cyclic lactone autoinducer peptide [Desulfosporosinus hippei]SDH22174.1 cyclic lactone autoinducer peptide [Desulfosporosinus hippei DSM 8344]